MTIAGRGAEKLCDAPQLEFTFWWKDSRTSCFTVFSILPALDLDFFSFPSNSRYQVLTLFPRVRPTMT